MNRWSVLAALLALAAGLALRVPSLGARPLHNDEAVNAIKAAELWEHGRYAYDPHEYHGPTLHYFSRLLFSLSGARDSGALNNAVLRLAPVVFGAGLILLLFLFADGLGRQEAAWAAFFAAVSPAMVFYSRYFIHEMLLVFFTALTLGAGWRYARARSAGWALAAGVGLGLMFATKETFVITLAAAVLAGGATLLKHWPGEGLAAGFKRNWNGRHAMLAAAAALAVWLVFFSSFFSNFQGLPDSILTYLPWLKRAGGDSPHIHPWHFYLERLAWFHPAKGPVWSEALILALAAVGAAVSLAKKRAPLHWFLVFFTFFLTAAYSVISYKTPWCLLNFFLGMILLAGVGAAAVVEWFRPRAMKAAAGLVLLAFGAQLAWQAWRAGIVFPADPKNPYVYAQTSPDLANLAQRIEGIGGVAPDGFNTVVKVMAPDSDYWPLPWQLRRFKNVGWYDSIPDDPYAPIMVAGAGFDAQFDEKSSRKWIMAGLSELRPGVFLELYVELELWKKYVETLPPPVD